MRKFIILNYSYNKIRPSYVTSIAVSSSDITDGILTNESIAEFYKNDKNYKIIYLDTEEGKTFVKDLLYESDKKFNIAAQEMEKQKNFMSKIINLIDDSN